jgi:hypothetical protein
MNWEGFQKISRKKESRQVKDTIYDVMISQPYIKIYYLICCLLCLVVLIDQICVSKNIFNFSASTYERVLDTNSQSNSYANIIQSYITDFGIYSKAQRKGRTSYLGKNREHSFPLITVDGFRMMADIIVDEPTSEQADSNSFLDYQSKSACESVGRNLNLGKQQVVVLFINSKQVLPFFSSGCFESIPISIVLITHNGDEDQPSDGNSRYLDQPNLVHWFAQNCDRVHDKLTCIPIGIENRQWGPPSIVGSHGSMPELLLGMMATRMPAYSASELSETARRDQSYQHTWSYFPGKTHISRDDVISILEKINPHWIRTNGSSNGERYFVTEYYRNVIQYVAMVCPRGNGRDTVRAWESLYLGRVIITLHSPADKLWDGLPVVLLDSWEELPNAENEILYCSHCRIIAGYLYFNSTCSSLINKSIFLNPNLTVLKYSLYDIPH